MNWNVKIAYIQSVMAAIGMGIAQTAFSVYVTQGLGQPNLVLGTLFTTSGLASTIFVFPSGYFADKYRRDILIRISFFFGILSQIALVFATSLIDPDITLAALFIAQALGGLGWGLSGPAAQALLADSIESGDRSRVFAKMHFVNLLASAIGPFLAAGLTLILGDNWGIETLTNLIFLGAICTSLAYIAVFFASDSKALVSRIERTDLYPNTTKDSQTNDREIVDPSNFTLFGRPFSYNVVVPTIMVISGIIIGFGAGATVAFFPVLFADPKIGYGLQPLFTYLIFGITNIVTGFAGIFAQRMIRILGRIGSMFFTQGLAIICLLGLVVNLILYQSSLITIEFSIALLVVFYISRNALMNASGPVSRSIVMDIVPAKSRAKWNSLETLAWGMFWSVSASIGGFIVDNFGFLYVFFFTATLYTIATLILLSIKNRVPKESILTREYQLGKLKTRNRVVLPTSLNGNIKAAEEVSGQITSDAISYYAETAKGGTGLIYLPPAYISLSAKGQVNQIGIHDDYTIHKLKDVVRECHKYGALIGIRLAHAGAFALGVADSKIENPNQMSYKQLYKVLDDYICALGRVVHAGFDIVELSSCFEHDPDFFTQFISPKYNKRTDEYGTTFENRIKFPIEVIQAIKRNLPESLMLSYYLSVPQQGLTDEIIEYVKILEEVGIELLSLEFVYQSTSSSNVVNQILHLRKEAPSLPLVLNGTFDVSSAEALVKKGQADFIGLSQMIQKDKSFPQALK